MKNTKLAVTLTTTALLAGEVACTGPTSSGGARTTDNKPAVVQAAKLSVLSKVEMRKLLAGIEQAKEPAPQMGAMCYSPFTLSVKTAYVCPRCGAKTIFADDGAFDFEDVLRCRALLQKVPHHEAMTLDESSYCRQCRPDAEKSELVLTIRFDDGTRNVVHGVMASDLVLIAAALKGEAAIDGPGELESVFSKLLRLRELLGIKE